MDIFQFAELMQVKPDEISEYQELLMRFDPSSYTDPLRMALLILGDRILALEEELTELKKVK